MEATKALLFDIHKYDRYNLDRMNENELYGLAMKGEDYATQVLTLEELSDGLNDQTINIDRYWLYFTH
jgi:hypothetical protein